MYIMFLGFYFIFTISSIEFSEYDTIIISEDQGIDDDLQLNSEQYFLSEIWNTDHKHDSIQRDIFSSRNDYEYLSSSSKDEHSLSLTKTNPEFSFIYKDENSNRLFEINDITFAHTNVISNSQNRSINGDVKNRKLTPPVLNQEQLFYGHPLLNGNSIKNILIVNDLNFAIENQMKDLHPDVVIHDFMKRASKMSLNKSSLETNKFIQNRINFTKKFWILLKTEIHRKILLRKSQFTAEGLDIEKHVQSIVYETFLTFGYKTYNKARDSILKSVKKKKFDIRLIYLFYQGLKLIHIATQNFPRQMRSSRFAGMKSFDFALLLDLKSLLEDFAYTQKKEIISIILLRIQLVERNNLYDTMCICDNMSSKEEDQIEDAYEKQDYCSCLII